VGRPDPATDRSTEYLQKNQVILNWYPKIQAMKSGGLVGGDADAAPNQAHLGPRHVAFLDVDELYFELERFKAERGWYNLNITRQGVEGLLADQSWYQLLSPPEELAFDSFERVRLWQEIALALLKKYVERYYTFRKREWELPHLEYRDLEADDPNFLGVAEASNDSYYRILLDRSQEDRHQAGRTQRHHRQGELNLGLQGMKASGSASTSHCSVWIQTSSRSVPRR
jgi:hypothetical protein